VVGGLAWGGKLGGGGGGGGGSFYPGVHLLKGGALKRVEAQRALRPGRCYGKSDADYCLWLPSHVLIALALDKFELLLRPYGVCCVSV